MSDIISNNLSGLNSLYTDSTTYSSKTSSLENTLNNSDLSTADSDKLMSVCKDFEEYFVEQMVKSMVAQMQMIIHHFLVYHQIQMIHI